MDANRKDDGGSAFPQPDLSGYGMGPSLLGDGETYDVRGMSLRDWFATHAQVPEQISVIYAEALVGRKLPNDSVAADNARDVVLFWFEADAAYRYLAADAMLAERAKGGA